MKRLAYIIFLLEVLLTSCKRPDEVDFMLLYTTQTYGSLLPWDFKNDTTEKVSLANFMSLVKEQRAIYGDRCIVLDNGNMHTRGLTNFYYRYIDTVSEPISYKVQRYIGYDAVAMGHSDLRLREPFYYERHDSTDCPPTICANLFDKRTGKNCFHPWVYLEREGIRIIVFSLVDEQADGWTPELGNPNVECHEMVNTMRDQVLTMRHLYNPDIVIGLICSSRSEVIQTLQEQIPGIDYIIQNNKNDTRINGKTAGMTRIRLTRNKKTDTYSKNYISAKVDLSQYEIDHDYSVYFDHDIQTIRESYCEEFGNLDADIQTSYGIYSAHDYYRDLLHQAHLWYSGADVSLANIAHADIVIPKGPVNIAKISTIFNHENVLVTFKITGKELKEILESFYAQQYYQMHSANDPLLALALDKKGHLLYNSEGQPYLNVPASRFTSASGLYYTVDLRRPQGDRVTIYKLNNGKEYHTDSVYTMTTNSYTASGFGNKKYLPYLNWDKDEIFKRLTDISMPSLTYVIYKYFKECPGAYTPSPQKTCDYIPEDWWRTAKARELSNLNPTW